MKYINKLSIWTWYYNHDKLSLVISYDGKIFWISFERLFKLKKICLFSYPFLYTFNDYIQEGIKYFFQSWVHIWELISINISEEYFINISSFKYDNFVYHELSDHHLLHAYSSYFLSNFNYSVIIVIDWFWFMKSLNKHICQSLYYWNNNYINLLNYQEYSFKKWLIWIGEVYKMISELLWLEEWSLMGLSWYWDYNRFSNIELFDYKEWNVIFKEKYIEKIYKNNFSKVTEVDFFIFFKELFWIKDKDYIQKKDDITKSIFADIASKLQYDTERAIIYISNFAYEKTWADNICFSWWVALNILANSKILKETKFKKLFIWPWVCDFWIWLGAVLRGNYLNNIDNKILKFNWQLWLKYDNKLLKKLFIKYKDCIKVTKIDWYSLIADLLNDNKIIWWFQWWSEFWQRALWNRSILASPKNIENRDLVNLIKGREFWRPLAPSIIEENLSDYFDTKINSPYMTLSGNVLKTKIKDIPWIIHIDGTSRYHTVNYKQNHKFYFLLKEFYKISWTPILTNTSFNVKWQPIVESPEDAILCFLSTKLDLLVIWKFLISKSNIYDEFSYNKELIVLSSYHNDLDSQKLYIERRKKIGVILFWKFLSDKFIFNFWWFSYILNINWEEINIKISKINNDKDIGYYFKVNNLILEIISDNVWENIILNEKIIKHLKKIKYIIIINYHIIYKLL